MLAIVIGLGLSKGMLLASALIVGVLLGVATDIARIWRRAKGGKGRYDQ